MRKMVGNAQKGFAEMAAAAYAVWYFAYTKDPFGTGSKAQKSNHLRSRAWKAKARKRGARHSFRWHGPNTRIRR